jgi:hypothetical protein
MNRALLSFALLALAGTASAQVGIDGVIGADWTGASSVAVNYNSSAAQNNFGAPTNENHVVAYNVLTRQDSSYLYVAVVTNTAGGGTLPAAQQFANLYFGGNTSVGFEVTNNRAFIPGVPGYTSLSSLVGTSNEVFWASNFTGSEYVIEMAVPISFFATDPLSMGFAPLTGAPGADFTRISLSQSYGYSVAGGQSFYGTNRLGAFTGVPSPAAAGLLGLGGLMASRRRR